MSNPANNKSQLREQLRSRRRLLAAEERHAAASAISRQANELPTWNASQHIAIYLPADGEIDTGPLTRSCREQAKSLYLPIVDQDRKLEFALWIEGDELHNNRFGIPEPGANAKRVPPHQLNIIFMPLVGWDPSGNRLGMGGGFYDRALAGIEGPIKVGLAYDCQRTGRISQDPWDVPLDFVLTESALNHCETARAASDVNPG